MTPQTYQPRPSALEKEVRFISNFFPWPRLVQWHQPRTMLRTFVDQRPTLRREANLETGPGGSTLVSQQIHHLLILLRQQLFHHQFPQAAATMETITMATDKVVGVVRKIGLEPLLSNCEAYTESLQFYKQMFSKYEIYREENLLEMAFFIISHGNLQEAYDAMEGMVHISPFRGNPLFHGYCGLLQLMLWRRERASEENENSHQTSSSSAPPTSSKAPPTPHYHQPLRKGGGAPLSGKAESHAKASLAHFDELQREGFPGSYVIDSFVYKHSELLECLGRVEEAGAVLLNYKRRHPRRINPNRYLCDHLRRHHGDATTQRITHLSDLVSCDESCDEAVELAELLLQRDSANPTPTFHLLLHFLDYPVNGGSEKAVRLLDQIQTQWPECRSDQQWTSRLQWWSKLYPQ